MYEFYPPRHPYLSEPAFEEGVDSPLPPLRDDFFVDVEGVAQREHDLRLRPARAQEVEGGQQLAVDPTGHVVDDQHVGIEALGDRPDEILAQAAYPVEADVEMTGAVGIRADLLHGGQLDEVDARWCLEHVGGLEAGHDEDRGLGQVATQVAGDREAPAEVPEPEGVVRVEEQSGSSHFL